MLSSAPRRSFLFPSSLLNRLKEPNRMCYLQCGRCGPLRILALHKASQPSCRHQIRLQSGPFPPLEPRLQHHVVFSCCIISVIISSLVIHSEGTRLSCLGKYIQPFPTRDQSQMFVAVCGGLFESSGNEPLPPPPPPCWLRITVRL